MVVAHRITEAEYREFVLSDPDGAWELWDGELREKPMMSVMHGDVTNFVGELLRPQLNRRAFRVYINSAMLHVSPERVFIPDVAVVPTALVLPHRNDPKALNAYADPLPLIVEVHPPSTERYDLTVKLDGYRSRGDLEIWLVHPFQRTLTAWRRQPDGSYAEEAYGGGTGTVASLPNVAIDLDVLFAG